MSGPPFAAQLNGMTPSSMARVVSKAVAPRGAAIAVAQSSLAACAEAALATQSAATNVVLVFLNMNLRRYTGKRTSAPKTGVGRRETKERRWIADERFPGSTESYPKRPNAEAESRRSDEDRLWRGVRAMGRWVALGHPRVYPYRSSSIASVSLPSSQTSDTSSSRALKAAALGRLCMCALDSWSRAVRCERKEPSTPS